MAIFRELTPVVQALGARRQRTQQEELLQRAMAGDQAAMSQLIAQDPAAAFNIARAQKAQQETQQAQQQQEQMQGLMQLIQPRQDYSQWMPEGAVLEPGQMQGLLTGMTPTQAGIAPPPMQYPSPEQVRNIAMQQGILGDDTLQKVLTGQAQAGYHEAGEMERYAGAEYQLARTQDVLQEIRMKEEMHPLDIQRVGEEVNKLQAEIIKLGADSDRLRATGDKVAAEVEEQKIINEYLPELSRLKNEVQAAIRDKTRAEGVETSIPVMTPEEALKAGQVEKGTRIVSPPQQGDKLTPLNADGWERLRKLTATLEQQRQKAESKFKIASIRTRQQAEDEALEKGLEPEHPQVKAVLDRYFPETAQPAGQATSGRFKIISVE